MSERPIEELQAGNAVRDLLIPRCDRFHDGPLWYGWAIMDAFLAGIDYSKAGLDAKTALLAEAKTALEPFAKWAVIITAKPTLDDCELARLVHAKLKVQGVTDPA